MANLEERAARLLEQNNVRRAPVPVEAIARAIGLDVRYSPTTDDVSGALIRRGKVAIVAVNSAQHENRQRFTIAHELGHYVLHKGVEPHFDDDFRIDFRNTVSGEATLSREIEANRFAAAILMPEAFLKRDVQRLPTDLASTDEIIRSLAIRYKVSRRAMELRLVNLGFVSPID